MAEEAQAGAGWEGEGPQPATDTPQTKGNPVFVCPECSKEFARPQALGAHRKQVHGIAGSSQRSRSRKGTAGRGVAAKNDKPVKQRSVAEREGLDTDRLLRDLFPNGMPAKTEVIQATSEWLAKAEAISKMR